MAALTHGLHLQRANHGSGESSFKKLMRESQSSQRCGSNIEMVWHFCRVKTFALFHADSLRTPASRLRASTRSRESARVPPDTRREASTTKASR